MKKLRDCWRDRDVDSDYATVDVDSDYATVLGRVGPPVNSVKEGVAIVLGIAVAVVLAAVVLAGC